jgi:hypothetical protein
LWPALALSTLTCSSSCVCRTEVIGGSFMSGSPEVMSLNLSFGIRLVVDEKVRGVAQGPKTPQWRQVSAER